MLNKFRFSFEELNIVAGDLTELLGFTDGIIPEPFPEMIEEALKIAPQYCEICGGYKIFETIKIDTGKQTITIAGKTFSPTRVITTQLKKSELAALYICTAGEKISVHANSLNINGDPLTAYIFDVIGSVTVEKAMDRIQEIMASELLKNSLHISDRYSPGYCDWSVAEQQLLFSLMPDNMCGVKLSESSLMNPIKSVSGIIGIGPEMKQKGYQCDWCSDKNCIYGIIKKQNRKTQKRKKAD